MSKKSTIAGQRVIEGNFKGNATIGIWNVDANGTPIGTAPIIAFGYNKARAIVDNFQTISQWVSLQEKPAPAIKKINVEELSDADILAIQTRLATIAKK
jgi:hypothetical protein